MDSIVIVVRGGMVEEVYSSKPAAEVLVDVIDFDSTSRSVEEEAELEQQYEDVC